MSRNSNKEKSEQLGMPHGTARARLVKDMMFHLAHKCGMGDCFQCGKSIVSIDDFTIEHKVPWMHSESPAELYFDLDNIAFSHLSCNIQAKRIKLVPCPSAASYSRGCRCEPCVQLNREAFRNYYKRVGRKDRRTNLQ